MALKKGEGRLPEGFGEVALSRATGWSYWEVVTQPAWFLDRLVIYTQAEEIAQRLKSKEAELGAKLRGSRLRKK